jgi:hypothetical protein
MLGRLVGGKAYKLGVGSQLRKGQPSDCTSGESHTLCMEIAEMVRGYNNMALIPMTLRVWKQVQFLDVPMRLRLVAIFVPLCLHVYNYTFPVPRLGVHLDHLKTAR